MKTRKRYYKGTIVSHSYSEFIFVKGDVHEVIVSSNLHQVTVSYLEGELFSSLPSDIFSVITDTEIDLEGVFLLFTVHYLNGLEFIKRTSGDCIITQLLDYLQDGITLESMPEGEAILISPSFSDLENFKTYVNITSTMIYVVGGTYSFTNIFGINLGSDEVSRSFKSTEILNANTEFITDEVSIVYSFIEELEKTFPEVGFYNFSGKVPNDSKEHVFYEVDLAQFQSNKFTSKLQKSSEMGSFYQTTIPLKISYETTDVQVFITRRLKFLSEGFLNDVHTFTVTKDLPTALSSTGEKSITFVFKTYWERATVEDDYKKEQSKSGTGRRVYSFETIVSLIVLLYEKKNDIKLVSKVLGSIYTVESASNITT